MTTDAELMRALLLVSVLVGLVGLVVGLAPGSWAHRDRHLC